MAELQIKNQTISKEIDQSHSLNFKLLREEGIRLIGEHTGQTWTDFNTHDPGITILEALCYALTDLGLRANLDILDLLAQANSSNLPIAGMFPIEDILPAAPLTINDYRKLLVLC